MRTNEKCEVACSSARWECEIGVSIGGLSSQDQCELKAGIVSASKWPRRLPGACGAEAAVMLLFCPGCGNGLIVEEGQRCHRFACNTCPYVHNITRKVGPGARRRVGAPPAPSGSVARPPKLPLSRGFRTFLWSQQWP